MITQEIRNQIFNQQAHNRSKWLQHSNYYQEDLLRLFRFLVPKGNDILEIGCGIGQLLAGVEPKHGLGVDAAEEMVKQAREEYPNLDWECADIESGEGIEGSFDYIIMSNVLGLVDDVQLTLDKVHQIAEGKTRIIVSYYSRLWQPVLKFAERIGLKMPEPEQNWLSLEDIVSLFELSGYEVLRTGRRMLVPFYIPLVSEFINTFIARLPGINRMCLTTFLVARKRPLLRRECSVSVVIPTKDEAGNISGAIERLPEIGTHTEIIFVDGNSTDGTVEEIDAVINQYPDRDIKFMTQSGSGKGNAVFEAFDQATGELLIILDSDLAVPPEELVKFYEPFAEGRAEFLNGCRLVYPMNGVAMRYLNLVANHFFARSFSIILGFKIKDTLCGTKAISRQACDRLKKNRHFFGKLDPFGDFDLILGAARLNLKMLDVPIHYHERKYGDIKINRFTDGILLFRVMIRALWLFRNI